MVSVRRCVNTAVGGEEEEDFRSPVLSTPHPSSHPSFLSSLLTVRDWTGGHGGRMTQPRQTERRVQGAEPTRSSCGGGGGGAGYKTPEEAFNVPSFLLNVSDLRALHPLHAYLATTYKVLTAP